MFLPYLVKYMSYCCYHYTCICCLGQIILIYRLEFSAIVAQNVCVIMVIELCNGALLGMFNFKCFVDYCIFMY